MEVVLSDLALESMANIALYVCDAFSLDVAEAVSRRVASFIQSLGAMPRIGVRVDELYNFGEIRRVLYKQNRIYYLIDGDTITIIIVWDGRQDPNRVKAMIRQYLEKAATNLRSE